MPSRSRHHRKNSSTSKSLSTPNQTPHQSTPTTPTTPKPIVNLRSPSTISTKKATESSPSPALPLKSPEPPTTSPIISTQSVTAVVPVTARSESFSELEIIMNPVNAASRSIGMSLSGHANGVGLSGGIVPSVRLPPPRKQKSRKGEKKSEDVDESTVPTPTKATTTVTSVTVSDPEVKTTSTTSSSTHFAGSEIKSPTTTTSTPTTAHTIKPKLSPSPTQSQNLPPMGTSSAIGNVKVQNTRRNSLGTGAGENGMMKKGGSGVINGGGNVGYGGGRRWSRGMFVGNGGMISPSSQTQRPFTFPHPNPYFRPYQQQPIQPYPQQPQRAVMQYRTPPQAQAQAQAHMQGPVPPRFQVQQQHSPYQQHQQYQQHNGTRSSVSATSVSSGSGPGMNTAQLQLQAEKQAVSSEIKGDQGEASQVPVEDDDDGIKQKEVVVDVASGLRVFGFGLSGERVDGLPKAHYFAGLRAPTLTDPQLQHRISSARYNHEVADTPITSPISDSALPASPGISSNRKTQAQAQDQEYKMLSPFTPVFHPHGFPINKGVDNSATGRVNTQHRGISLAQLESDLRVGLPISSSEGMISPSGNVYSSRNVGPIDKRDDDTSAESAGHDSPLLLNAEIGLARRVKVPSTERDLSGDGNVDQRKGEHVEFAGLITPPGPVKQDPTQGTHALPGQQKPFTPDYTPGQSLQGDKSARRDATLEYTDSGRRSRQPTLDSIPAEGESEVETEGKAAPRRSKGQRRASIKGRGGQNLMDILFPEAMTTSSDVEDNLADSEPDSISNADTVSMFSIHSARRRRPSDSESSHSEGEISENSGRQDINQARTRRLTGMSASMRGGFVGRVLQFGQPEEDAQGNRQRTISGLSIISNKTENTMEANNRLAGELQTHHQTRVQDRQDRQETLRCDTCGVWTATTVLTLIRPCKHLACFDCLNAVLNTVCSNGPGGNPGRSKCSTLACGSEVFDITPYLLADDSVRQQAQQVEDREKRLRLAVDALPDEDESTIVVRMDNVAWDVTPEMVKDFLPPCTLAENVIQNVHIMIDRNDGRAKDYLYLEAKDKDAACEILRNRQSQVMGTTSRARPIVLTLSNHKELIAELRPSSPNELHNLVLLCRSSASDSTTPIGTPSQTPRRSSPGGSGGSPASTGKYLKSRTAAFNNVLSLLSRLAPKPNGERSGGQSSVIWWDMFSVTATVITTLAKRLLANQYPMRPNMHSPLTSPSISAIQAGQQQDPYKLTDLQAKIRDKLQSEKKRTFSNDHKRSRTLTVKQEEFKDLRAEDEALCHRMITAFSSVFGVNVSPRRDSPPGYTFH